MQDCYRGNFEFTYGPLYSFVHQVKLSVLTAIMALKLSPWLHPLSPSMIYTSSCVICFLAIIIGNFGVSDADVALGRSHQTTSPNSSISSTRSGSVSTSTTGAHLIHHQTSETHRLMNTEVSGHRSRGTLTNSDSELLEANSLLPLRNVASSQNQPYFPSPRRLQPTSTFRSRQKRKALDGTLDDMGEKKFETNYPLPVSLVDGAWPTEGDGSLDRLVIRALERSHGWAQLSATLEKVDGELKKLLSIEAKKHSTDSTVNGSIGSSTTSERDMLKSAQYGESIPKESPYRSSSNKQDETHVPTHNHLKDKFTYRRVRDLKHQRAIAAVVALEPCDLNGNGNKASDIGGPSVSPLETGPLDVHVARSALKKQYEHSGNHSIRHLHHHLNNLQYHHKSHHHHHKKQYRAV